MQPVSLYLLTGPRVDLSGTITSVPSTVPDLMDRNTVFNRQESFKVPTESGTMQVRPRGGRRTTVDWPARPGPTSSDDGPRAPAHRSRARERDSASQLRAVRSVRRHHNALAVTVRSASVRAAWLQQGRASPPQWVGGPSRLVPPG